MHRDRPRRVALDIRSLLGVQDLFRVSAGRQRDPAVDLWLNAEPQALRAIARQWFAQLRACGDDVCELMHDGCPVACVGDAPFGYVATFKTHVNVGFFYGAALADPSGLLLGSGKRMRHVKLKPDSAIATDNLRELIHAAYADIRRRLGE